MRVPINSLSNVGGVCVQSSYKAMCYRYHHLAIESVQHIQINVLTSLVQSFNMAYSVLMLNPRPLVGCQPESSVNWETEPIQTDAPFTAPKFECRDLKNDQVIFEKNVRGQSRISVYIVILASYIACQVILNQLHAVLSDTCVFVFIPEAVNNQWHDVT